MGCVMCYGLCGTSCGLWVMSCVLRVMCNGLCVMGCAMGYVV